MLTPILHSQPAPPDLGGDGDAKPAGKAPLPVIRLFHVCKEFGAKKALVDVSLDISRNDFVFVTGPSGAGKSTLLKLLYKGDTLTRGQVIVDGINLARIPRRRVPMLRRNLGIVFQDYKLIATKNIFDNVALALEAAGEKRREIEKRVLGLLKIVGMAQRRDAYPPSLSGGEQQRVAVARAVAGNPRIILADEPTASLDADSAAVIFRLLKVFHARGTTVLIATHDTELIRKAGGRVVLLKAGYLMDDKTIAGQSL